MTDTLQLTTTNPLPIVQAGVSDLLLSATKPTEMESCQRGLIEWCHRKILAVKAEWEDLKAAMEEARKRKWKTSTLQRHAGIAGKRVTFYEKILAALEAGYILVPNFPVTLFAIRTDKEKPAALFKVHESNWRPGFNQEQKAKELPVGEGEYKNPLPHTIEECTKVHDGKGGEKNHWECYADEWKEIDFPMNMAKAHLMEATGHAMQQKIFDELGVLPSPYKKKDPLIVGRIKDPRASKWERDGVITFIIAWHLDTRTL